jgi:hypothetical protein
MAGHLSVAGWAIPRALPQRGPGGLGLGAFRLGSSRSHRRTVWIEGGARSAAASCGTDLSRERISLLDSPLGWDRYNWFREARPKPDRTNGSDHVYPWADHIARTEVSSSIQIDRLTVSCGIACPTGTELRRLAESEFLQQVGSNGTFERVNPDAPGVRCWQ